MSLHWHSSLHLSILKVSIVFFFSWRFLSPDKNYCLGRIKQTNFNGLHKAYISVGCWRFLIIRIFLSVYLSVFQIYELFLELPVRGVFVALIFTEFIIFMGSWEDFKKAWLCFYLTMAFKDKTGKKTEEISDWAYLFKCSQQNLLVMGFIGNASRLNLISQFLQLIFFK